MDYEYIIFETSDEIATITLNRPERLNAWTYEMGLEIWDAIDKVENDPKLRVIIDAVLYLQFLALGFYLAS